MRLIVVAATIFCLVCLVEQGSSEQIKTIRRIVYNEDFFDEPHHHHHHHHYRRKIKPTPPRNIKTTCDCDDHGHDVRLPSIAFYQLGGHSVGEELSIRFPLNNNDDLPDPDFQLPDLDPRLPALDPRLRKRYKNNRSNKNVDRLFDDDEFESGRHSSLPLDPRLSQPSAQANPQPPTQANPQPPTQANPQPPTQANPQPPAQANPQPPAQANPQPPTQANPQPPTQANPQPPTQANPQPPAQANPQPPAQANPQPPQTNSQVPATNSNPPVDPQDTEPVITPEEWEEFIGALTPARNRNLDTQERDRNRNRNARGRIM